jgi:pentapeptide MXKDX repeat protein
MYKNKIIPYDIEMNSDKCEKMILMSLNHNINIETDSDKSSNYSQINLVSLVKPTTQTMIHDTMIHDTMIHDTMIHDTMIHDTMIHDTMIHDTMINQIYDNNDNNNDYICNNFCAKSKNIGCCSGFCYDSRYDPYNITISRGNCCEDLCPECFCDCCEFKSYCCSGCCSYNGKGCCSDFCFICRSCCYFKETWGEGDCCCGCKSCYNNIITLVLCSNLFCLEPCCNTNINIDSKCCSYINKCLSCYLCINIIKCI